MKAKTFPCVDGVWGLRIVKDKENSWD